LPSFKEVAARSCSASPDARRQYCQTSMARGSCSKAERWSSERSARRSRNPDTAIARISKNVVDVGRLSPRQWIGNRLDPVIRRCHPTRSVQTFCAVHEATPVEGRSRHRVRAACRPAADASAARRRAALQRSSGHLQRILDAVAARGRIGNMWRLRFGLRATTGGISLAAWYTELSHTANRSQCGAEWKWRSIGACALEVRANVDSGGSTPPTDLSPDGAMALSADRSGGLLASADRPDRRAQAGS
jgi:hypothetical protein